MSALRVDEVQQHARKRLHMIGNAHLDIAWLWPCWEGFASVKATFRSALDRMREYPDFSFSASSAAYYEWIEENDPPMFEEIRQRVAEGRWNLVGGWWVEPDCNLPGGESLVRQALIGQTYFQERFGRTATVGYNVDSFGHPASLPQILRKSGLTSYVFMRPEPHERKLPARAFTWESVDGSRVTAFRVPFQYCTSVENLAEHVERCAADFDGGAGASMCFFGVGNHGGGPTKANIEMIRRLAEESEVEMTFSSPGQYFDDLRPVISTLPVVRDELQHHASGCYAAHSGVKQWNRQAENRLLLAEKFSTIANVVAGLRPKGALRHAWKNVLLNQFHDILAGTSLEIAYDDARDAYGEAMTIANRSLHQALQSIAWKIDIPTDDHSTPVVVFNPHSWASRANLELETDGLDAATALVDEQGRTVPLQTIAPRVAVEGRRRVTFTTDLPPLGYRVLRTGKSPVTEAAQPTRGSSIENDQWRLSIDPQTAAVASLMDRRHNCEVLSKPGGRAVVLADESDTWGHGVLRFQQEIGTFAPVHIAITEQGPVRAAIRVESRYQSSTLVQEFTLLNGCDVIVVKVMVDWHERHQVLKLRWPVAVRMPKATFEIAYGTIERPLSGDEEPGQSWFDLTGAHERTGDSYGLSILNDAKYSFDVRGSEMSLTVLRSPAYAHHDPYRPASWDDVVFLDQGIQRFTYALLPHAGDWRQAQTARRAAELNQPPIGMIDTFHGGTLAASSTFIEAQPESVEVTALKLAEDGSGDIVVRCFETAGEPAKAVIRMPFLNQLIETSFKPHEIKTFRVGTCIQEVDVLEGSI